MISCLRRPSRNSSARWQKLNPRICQKKRRRHNCSEVSKPITSGSEEKVCHPSHAPPHLAWRPGQKIPHHWHVSLGAKKQQGLFNLMLCIVIILSWKQQKQNTEKQNTTTKRKEKCIPFRRVLLLLLQLGGNTNYSTNGTFTDRRRGSPSFRYLSPHRRRRSIDNSVPSTATKILLVMKIMKKDDDHKSL